MNSLGYIYNDSDSDSDDKSNHKVLARIFKSGLKQKKDDKDIINFSKLKKTIDIPRHYYIIIAVLILVLCIYFIFYKI